MRIDEIPPVAISWGRTTVFKTGAWRNVTPHYIKQLPPCRAGCPVGNDVEGWLEAAGNDKWDDAVRLLLQEQPLPSVCGRVCYHPCQTVCNRAEYDSSVSIRAVERFLGDRAYRLGMMPDKRQTPSFSSGKVLIIGSGPSGLATAWLLARLGHRVEVAERADKSGGLLRYGIPDYRLPQNVLDREIRRLSELGITFSNGVEVTVNDDFTSLRREFDALYIAPGASGHRTSGIKNSEGAVIGAIEFLTEVAKGSKPEVGKTIAVIGGGNSAIDAARAALRFGADVVILYRRTRVEMPAFEEEVEAALEEGVKIEFLVNPVAVVDDQISPPACGGGIKGGGASASGGGSQRGRLLRCIHNQLGEPDASGRRRPEPIPGSEFEIQVDTIIDAVGEYPDPSRFSPDKDIQNALISIDKWGKTGVETVWAGGDFSAAEWSVTHAIGAGKRVAIDIDLYLNNADRAGVEGLILSDNNAISVQEYIANSPPTGIRRKPDKLSALPVTAYESRKQVEFEALNLAYHPRASETAIRELAPEVRRSDFSEIVKDWRIRSAAREAKRCFHCGTCDSCGNCHVFCPDGAVKRDPVTGALSFDLEYCKGCGVCEEECPRAAIEMKK
ncbi:MAG: FAD-dependent oxidoreductase [Calditrichaeota bacterium]|nr:FAD-dependent oxidoreductase [Calditrichota bacterium]